MRQGPTTERTRLAGSPFIPSPVWKIEATPEPPRLPARAYFTDTTSRAVKFEEIEQVIRWDLTHPERFEAAHGRRCTLVAVAQAHNVSREYVRLVIKRRQEHMDNQAVIEAVREEAERTRHELTLAIFKARDRETPAEAAERILAEEGEQTA